MKCISVSLKCTVVVCNKTSLREFTVLIRLTSYCGCVWDHGSHFAVRRVRFAPAQFCCPIIIIILSTGLIWSVVFHLFAVMLLWLCTDRMIYLDLLVWCHNSDGTMYRIEYRDIEVVSWHIFIAIITPQTKSIFHTTLSRRRRQSRLCRRRHRQRESRAA